MTKMQPSPKESRRQSVVVVVVVVVVLSPRAFQRVRPSLLRAPSPARYSIRRVRASSTSDVPSAGQASPSFIFEESLTF